MNRIAKKPKKEEGPIISPLAQNSKGKRTEMCSSSLLKGG